MSSTICSTGGLGLVLRFEFKLGPLHMNPEVISKIHALTTSYNSYPPAPSQQLLMFKIPLIRQWLPGWFLLPLCTCLARSPGEASSTRAPNLWPSPGSIKQFRSKVPLVLEHPPPTFLLVQPCLKLSLVRQPKGSCFGGAFHAFL